MWSDRPALSAWLEAIHADPAFGPTYHTDSQLAEKYPHLRAQFGG
jgi:hypothetical protein